MMRKDDAVSGVVGEMLMLSVVVILAALFAIAAMSFLPGEREEVVDITADFSDLHLGNTIVFTHRGGDVIAGSDLKVQVYRGLNPLSDTSFKIYEGATCSEGEGEEIQVFNLGDRIVLTAADSFISGDEIRITTEKSIIYSGRVP